MSVTLRERNSRDGDIIQYLTIYTNGKQYSESLGRPLYILKTDSKKEARKKKEAAEKIRSARELELFSKVTSVSLQDYDKNISIFDYFTKCMNERNGHTKKCWHSVYSLIEEYESDTTFPLRMIDTEWVRGFKNFLINGRSNNSARQYFLIFRICMNHAVDENIIAKSPCANVKNFKLEDKVRQYLTEEEIKILASSTLTKNQDLVRKGFLFCCFTGLRSSDAKSLTWGMISNTDQGLCIVKRMVKTRQVIRTYINKNAASLIGERGRDDEFVFPGYQKTETAINLSLDRIRKRIGLNKKITTHVARHTFATLLLTKNVDLYTVSKLLGHKDISTTQIYAKVIDQSKKDAVDELDSLSI